MGVLDKIKMAVLFLEVDHCLQSEDESACITQVGLMQGAELLIEHGTGFAFFVGFGDAEDNIPLAARAIMHTGSTTQFELGEKFHHHSFEEKRRDTEA